ncbi:Glycosyltransferase involved in cell wall bisynthesis [Nocardioides sp. YR527]|uniref:glycosyltransferase n=1 Tax=Nocardioides sp. YR527 TaxID=1881028 RepID=UPI0008858B45|nr:glycosyltransferase [Nocardioides sp. YR527]SDK25703.1 Glycosyltransferase involved in cell wall bisynthesis [Nocardioides sp. YR527]
MSLTHTVSVVIPVYRGAETLPEVVSEVTDLAEPFVTPDGHQGRVTEILLVHDHGPDASDLAIRQLAEKYDIVRPIWLSRNFGQHAATLAGLASSGSDWIVTMDEDGQHDPAYIRPMLDTALRERAALVYARPTNAAPHGPLRNLTSRGSKVVIDRLMPGGSARQFNSFRLILGEYGRSVSAYAANGVYLDVALSWVISDVATCPVELREEGERPSGYNYRSLMSHFWRMVLTGGTRLLRAVSICGALLAAAGIVLAVVLVVARLAGGVPVQGWTSLMAAVLVCSGTIMLTLGVIAEYLGVSVNMAMGKPLYVIVSDPANGPLRETPQPGQPE